MTWMSIIQQTSFIRHYLTFCTCSSRIRRMIAFLNIPASAAPPSPEGKPRRSILCLTVLYLSMLCLVPIVPTDSFGLTVTTGPMQEYLFDEGKKHYDAGELDRASEVWTNIFPDTLYGPITYLLLAQGKQRAGNDEAAEAFLQECLKRHSNSVYCDSARRTLAEVLFRQGKGEAKSLLLSLIAKASDKDKPAYTLKLAELERRLGNHSEAATQYRTLFLNYPASVEGLKAADDLASMVFHHKIPPLTFSEREQLARADRLFSKGRFDLAANSYEALLKTKPSDKGLMLKLAQCRYKGRQNQKAITILKDVLKGEVSEHDRMEALYLLSVVNWRLDRGKDFEFCCNRILEKGSLKLKRKVLYNVASYYFEKRKFDDAEAYFKKLLNAGPDPSVKANAKWKIAWIKYWSHKYGEAAEAFREIRAVSSGGRIDNASKYWQARCLLNSNRSREAQPLLNEIAKNTPLDYYGTEAARLLKTMRPAADTNNKSRQPLPQVVLTSEETSNPLVSAANKLMEKGLGEFALLNLEALPKSMKSSHSIAFLTAKAAYTAGRYREAQDTMASAFGTLAENPPEGAPAEFVEMAFPRIYFTETTRAAEKNSIDPHLVWAVIRQESRYDASAVSPAGALGLMQVTPAAAGIVKKGGKIPSKAVEDVLNPQQNLTLGIKILAKNVNIFKGKLVPAIASYNADIKKVHEWIQKYEKMKQDEFIENIPYLETRLYVKKVLAGYRAYGRLHAKKDLAGVQ
jgi:soluble lytic murein transglycosylase